jgi:MFS family permease
MNRFQHWLVMVILCLSGGFIFMLPFLREVYYIPMQQAFGYDNTQVGVLMSVFGTTSLLTYFPGGWLADRFSSRAMIPSSLLATGVGGVLLDAYPGAEGYRYFYLAIAGLCAPGTVAANIILRRTSHRSRL